MPFNIPFTSTAIEGHRGTLLKSSCIAKQPKDDVTEQYSIPKQKHIWPRIAIERANFDHMLASKARISEAVTEIPAWGDANDAIQQVNLYLQAKIADVREKSPHKPVVVLGSVNNQAIQR